MKQTPTSPHPSPPSDTNAANVTAALSPAEQLLLADAFRLAGAYSSDSRQLRAGQIFVALRGGAHDGHRFVGDILSRPNAGPAVVEQDFAQSYRGPAADKLIAVSQVGAAHRELARLARAHFRGKIIAVGGSSGKTTTKDFLFQILSPSLKTMKTEKSQNGELGVPRTLERLDSSLAVAIIEVGIDAPGDMARHAEIVQPDLAILTSIGEEHLNLLHDVDNVFREERILFEVTLARGGKCYAPGSDAYLKTLRDPGVTLVGSQPPAPLQLGLTHVYARQNAALGVAVAQELGLSIDEIQRGLDSLEMPEGRGGELRAGPRTWILTDHYNANLASMRGGLNHAREVARRESLPLALVLGDMLDLGAQTEALHAELARDIAAAQPARVMLVGPELAKIAPVLRAALPTAELAQAATSQIAAEQVNDWVQRECVILLKGSRGMALENVLRSWTAQIPTPDKTAR